MVLPIAIGWAGAELQQLLAIALIGGLITSTILTSIVLPDRYEFSEGLRIKVMRAWSLWQGNITTADSIPTSD
ncbi:MAG: hypothetical protein AB1489_28065 [Acidobacteriota bacterium]